MSHSQTPVSVYSFHTRSKQDVLQTRPRLDADARTGVSGYTKQSLAWATYYSYRAELVSCFIIACLPATKQLFESKIVPSVRRFTNAISSELKTAEASDSEKGNMAEGDGEQKPKPGITRVISVLVHSQIRSVSPKDSRYIET